MTRMLGLIRSMWLRFLVVCIAAAAAGFTAVFSLARIPPVEMLQVHDIDEITMHDGSIDMKVTAVRSRACDTHANQWLWQDTGTKDRYGRAILKYVSLPPTAAPPTPIDDETSYVVSIPLPSSVTPGVWHFWSRATDDCSWMPLLARPVREGRLIQTITVLPGPVGVPIQ